MTKQNRIKALIVDDEQHGRENLSAVLQRVSPEVNVVGEAASALAAIEAIESLQPALVFLDVEMPGGSGLQVVEAFPNPSFKVIFVTAYDQYAISAIRFAALDYILKPIDAFLIKGAVNRFQEEREREDIRLQEFLRNQQVSKQQKRLALSLQEKTCFVEINDVLCFQGESNYTHVYMRSGEKYLVSKPLIDFEEIVEEYGFLRPHKSWLVNVDAIKSFVKSDGGYLQLVNGMSVPVSRRKREKIKEMLNASLR